MNKEKALKLVGDFISEELEKESWYQKIKEDIKAIILYGSVAKGTNRPDSDIDVLIILPLKTEKKFTKGEYFYKHKNYEINIVLRSIEKLRKINFKKDGFQKEIFRNAEFIFEKDNKVREILASANVTREDEK